MPYRLDNYNAPTYPNTDFPALTIRKSECLDDWYSIIRKEHDDGEWWVPTEYGSALVLSQRISDCCVEGSILEMVGIAKAIITRSSVSYKRCACSVISGRHINAVEFWSPRNSQHRGITSIEHADVLAKEIIRTVAQGLVQIK